MITIWNTTLNHDKVSIYCAMLTPQWKQSLRSSSMQVGETWSLKCSLARLDSQNRKLIIEAIILIITEAKNAYFFVCKRTGFVHQELRDFVKMTLNWVASHWLWLEPCHSVKNVTRVESPFFSTWLESSPSHQKLWLETNHWLESRYHCWLEQPSCFDVVCSRDERTEKFFSPSPFLIRWNSIRSSPDPQNVWK